MPNYKELYMKLFTAAEDAIEMLITAQRECEEAILNEETPPLRIIDLAEKKE